jgi:hypothetical protein
MRASLAAVVTLLLSPPAATLASDWSAPPAEDEWILEPPPAPATSWTTPPQAYAPAAPAPAVPVDPVVTLVTALRDVEPWQAGHLVASDGRFARLTAADRARLLAAVEEPPQWWASILNVYPGLGLGSLISRDRRGVWLTASEVLGWTVVAVGLANDVADSGMTTGTQHTHSGDGLIAAGALLIVGSRVAGVILPFTFRGRRHAETEGALDRLPAALTVSPALLPVSPAPGAGGPGAALGLALRF